MAEQKAGEKTFVVPKGVTRGSRVSRPRRSSILKKPLGDIQNVAESEDKMQEKRRVSFLDKVFVKEFQLELKQKQLETQPECHQENIEGADASKEDKTVTEYMAPANKSFYHTSTPVGAKHEPLSSDGIHRLSVIPNMMDKSFSNFDDESDFQVFEDSSDVGHEKTHPAVMATNSVVGHDENSNKTKAVDGDSLFCHQGHSWFKEKDACCTNMDSVDMSLTLEDAEAFSFGKPDTANVTSTVSSAKVTCGTKEKEFKVVDSTCTETNALSPKENPSMIDTSTSHTLSLVRNTRDCEPICIPTTCSSGPIATSSFSSHQPLHEHSQVQVEEGVDMQTLYDGSMSMTCMTHHTSSISEGTLSPDTQPVIDKAIVPQPTHESKPKEDKKSHTSSISEGTLSPDTQPVIDEAIVPQPTRESKPKEDKKSELSCSNHISEFLSDTSMKHLQEARNYGEPEMCQIGTKHPQTTVPTPLVSKHLAVGTSTFKSINKRSYSPGVLTRAMERKMYEEFSIRKKKVTTPPSHGLAVTLAAFHQEECANQTKEVNTTGLLQTNERLQDLPTPSSLSTTKAVDDKTASVLTDIQDESSLSFHDLSSPVSNNAVATGVDSSQQPSLSQSLVVTQASGVTTLSSLASTIAGINKHSPSLAASSYPNIATPEIPSVGGVGNYTISPNITLLQPQEPSHDGADKTVLSPEPIVRMLSAACTEDSWTLKATPSSKKSPKSGRKRRKSQSGKKQRVKERRLSILESKLIDHLKQFRVRMEEVHKAYTLRYCQPFHMDNDQIKSVLKLYIDKSQSCVRVLTCLVDYAQPAETKSTEVDPVIAKDVAPIPDGGDFTDSEIDKAKWVLKMCHYFEHLYVSCQDTIDMAERQLGWSVHTWNPRLLEISIKETLLLTAHFESSKFNETVKTELLPCSKIVQMMWTHIKDSGSTDLAKFEELACDSTSNIPVVIQRSLDLL